MNDYVKNETNIFSECLFNRGIYLNSVKIIFPVYHELVKFSEPCKPVNVVLALLAM